MSSFHLSEHLVSCFHDQGFIKVENFIDQEQVDELSHDYDKAVSGEIHVPASGSDHIEGRMVQLVNPSQHIEGWQQHDYFLQACDVAKQLIGLDAVYVYDQMIFKPAHHPAEVPWHQDAGYWQKTRGSDNAVTCWLALSHAWKQNGGMQFITGSHRGKIAEHYNVSHRSEMNSALETKVDPSQSVSLSLEPGDVTFHHCRMLHHTGGNYTDTPRRGLITHFWAGD